MLLHFKSLSSFCCSFVHRHPAPAATLSAKDLCSSDFSESESYSFKIHNELCREGKNELDGAKTMTLSL